MTHPIVLVKETHIFDNLLGAPPVTLATLKAASSVFSSLSYEDNEMR